MENTLLSTEISKASQNLEIMRSQLPSRHVLNSVLDHPIKKIFKYTTIAQLATGLHI